MARRLARLGHILVVLSLLLALVPTSTGGTVALAQDGSEDGVAPIFLKAGTIYPEPGAPVEEVAPGRRGYYIVQFQGPVQEAWKAAVAALGADVLDYLPENAFKVRMSSAQAQQVAALDAVAWVGPFRAAYKLAPEAGRDGLYRVRVERGADVGQATAAIAQSGAQIIRSQGNILFVAADASQVAALAEVLDVAWIEPFTFPEKHNEYGAGQILGANTANANGYDGSTQTVAVADTGIGGGTAATAHPDIPATRIAAIYNWTVGNAQFCYRVRGDGAQDPDSGHGTHVSVSVLGDGGASGEGKGTAPAASLVFQSVEDYLDIYGACTSPTTPDGYYLIGLPDDLRQLYQQAYNAGARVHSNSWGSNAAGDYTLDSANSDSFVWSNPDMVITFSAGNEGIDANANGVVDNDSIGSPATAKNVITVGASENDRQGNYNCDTNLTYQSRDAYQPNTTCSGMGGQNILGTYGTRWPADYPANPLASDPTAGNKEQMASFSSRGPTNDGRIKPDVVAPGTWVLAGYSSLYQEGYGDPLNAQNGAYQLDGWGMPVNVSYKYFGGTSMSNPIVAGGAAVVRDYYQKAHDHNASAALVKATLINSAVDMLDENNDGADDNDFPIPNAHEGWGRVNLAAATNGSAQFVDNATGLNTGGTATYQFTVANPDAPFKVTLVWSDYPSTETASISLVNNLNLVVTAPGVNGAVYRGNVFDGGWSQTGGSADTRNNVENVYVQSADAGTWSVQVSGASVPQGPQPFALVVSGNFGTGGGDTPPTVSIDSPEAGADVSGNVQITANATDDNGVVSVEFFVDGSSIGPDSNGGDGWSINWNTTGVANGSHNLTARATDTIGQNTTSSAVSVNVNNPTQTTMMHVHDLIGSVTTGNGGKWNATVTIEIREADVGGAPGNVVFGASVSGSWSAGASGGASCTTNAQGRCSVSKNNLKSNVSSVTFTVTNVAKSGATYNSAANDYTAITVNKTGPATYPGGASFSEEPDEQIFLPFVGQAQQQ